MVRTSPSHGGNTGSNPVGVTKKRERKPSGFLSRALLPYIVAQINGTHETRLFEPFIPQASRKARSRRYFREHPTRDQKFICSCPLKVAGFFLIAAQMLPQNICNFCHLIFRNKIYVF